MDHNAQGGKGDVIFLVSLAAGISRRRSIRPERWLRRWIRLTKPTSFFSSEIEFDLKPPILTACSTAACSRGVIRSWRLEAWPKIFADIVLNLLAAQLDLPQQSISAKCRISCSMIRCRASSRLVQGRPQTVTGRWDSLKFIKSMRVAMAIWKCVAAVLLRNPIRLRMVLPPARVIVEEKAKCEIWASVVVAIVLDSSFLKNSSS